MMTKCMEGHEKESWNKIWQRQTLFSRIIDAGRFVYNVFFRMFLKKYLGRRTNFLEIGCGTSSLSVSLQPYILSLTGIDISPDALELSRALAHKKNFSSARFVIDDCRDLQIVEKFGVVWSQGLLEHFDDGETIVREHVKVLRDDGVALLSVPYRYSYHYVWYLVTRPALLRRFWPWTEQRFYTKKTLLALGKKVSPRACVHTLFPWIFGIIVLEVQRD
jgi:SAM-dependent methyltransferase